MLMFMFIIIIQYFYKNIYKIQMICVALSHSSSV